MDIKGYFVAVVVIVALGVRLVQIGSFMTADESNWMIRSGDFYHELFRNGNLGGTFQTTHPGATAMWLIGAGVTSREAQLGFDVDTSNLNRFREAATIPIAVVTSILIGLISWRLQRLTNPAIGLLGGVVLALNPYLIGLSQIAHLDALLALLMTLSVLFLLEWYKWPQTRLLMVAGILAGLAAGTKLLPALWLSLFFELVLLYCWLHSKRFHFTDAVRYLGFFVGTSALTLYAIWPVLWTQPDLGRSFTKDVPTVIGDAHVELEEGEAPIDPKTFYGRTLLGRTEPLVLLIAVSAVALAILKVRKQTRTSFPVWFFLYGLGFAVVISLAAKKGDRYAAPLLPILDIIATLGWGLFIYWVSKRFTLSRTVSNVLLALFPLYIFISSLGWYPHFISYSSPLFPNIRPLSQQGWGEGLEEAAAWFNQHPLAGELYVASWYPAVFEQYFHGKTMSLSSRTDNRVSYVVLYRNMFGRAPDTVASDVIDEYRDKTPHHVISIHGIPYVWIYATDSTELYRQHIGELRGSTTAGQLVPVTTNNWHTIDIGMANFSNRSNTQDVILHVRESVAATTDIRTVIVNAREIADGVFHHFAFDPIADSAGKTYYVWLESPTSEPGNAVTVRFVNADILPGQMVKDGIVIPERDVAWRIPEQQRQ